MYIISDYTLNLISIIGLTMRDNATDVIFGMFSGAEVS